MQNFQNEFTKKNRQDHPLRYYDFWNQRIEIYEIGVFFFLGRSEVSPKKLENFQKKFTQKRPDGDLQYYDVWNQSIDIYQKDTMIFEISSSRSIKETCI